MEKVRGYKTPLVIVIYFGGDDVLSLSAADNLDTVFGYDDSDWL